jgi:hypothetical protein
MQKIEVDMANKNLPEQAADERFAATVSETLDKSLVDIDEMSLQRLKNARAHALNQAAPSRKWISLSVAASLAALLLIPVVSHQYLSGSSDEQDLEVVVQEVPYSTEEMDDLEMLMALEDSDA